MASQTVAAGLAVEAGQFRQNKNDEHSDRVNGGGVGAPSSNGNGNGKDSGKDGGAMIPEGHLYEWGHTINYEGPPEVVELDTSHPLHPWNHSPLSRLVQTQRIALVSHFVLESGTVLCDVQVAFRTWGTLRTTSPNSDSTNAMVICHALTGSSDVSDWWGPLLGPSLVFDHSLFFLFCGNVLGSPYGSASPLTLAPPQPEYTHTSLAHPKAYGPFFPPTTVRDDVLLHHVVLTRLLGVRNVAAVVGGSMGGMATLEWPLCTPEGFVRNIVPIATTARHSAWGIAWGEAQRQSIETDPNFRDGWYAWRGEGEDEEEKEGPEAGLAAARMAALLTYRSSESFQSRFGRKEQSNNVVKGPPGVAIPPSQSLSRPPSQPNGLSQLAATAAAAEKAKQPLIFSCQSYLRYQGSKFVKRFDANCYLHITRKMDQHDVTRGRSAEAGHPLGRAPKGSLVIAISSDGLFSMSEQEEMVQWLKEGELRVIESAEGHDAFLLEFELINKHILEHLHRRLPEVYALEPIKYQEADEPTLNGAGGGDQWKVKKSSVFGEAEVDDDLADDLGVSGIKLASAEEEGRVEVRDEEGRVVDAVDIARW